MTNSFKTKAKVKLDLLINIDMLLMIENRIRARIFIYGYAKANNKYIKYYDKNEESRFLQYWDVNNLYGWLVSQKLWLNNFVWIKDTSQFDKNFMKKWCDEESDEGYFLGVDIRDYEKLHELHNDWKSWKACS